MGMTESDYHSSYELACKEAERLAEYEAAATLPDGRVLEPSEVAALRARCEAAVAVLKDICDHCGWKISHSGCATPECLIAKWRGPQEGATAHERV